MLGLWHSSYHCSLSGTSTQIPNPDDPDVAAKVRIGVAGESELRDLVMGADLWVLGRVLGRASGVRSWQLLLLNVMGSIPR